LHDRLARLVLRRARADQSEAVGGEGARAHGHLVRTDELAALRSVEHQALELLDRSLVGEDAQGHRGGLRDLLRRITEELRDDRLELARAVFGAHVADLRQRDQRGVEDVVGALLLEGFLDRR
ncbi:MAG: hypothetical protein ACK56I_08865, partial [bacterium]